jgi:tRNA dimethylallyltransferase
MGLENILDAAGDGRPVLIAGPTASGKSALAARIARRHGGVIVNADALQVFADWRVLTARPSQAEEAALPHALYGHVPGHTPYSVGHWLREVAPLLNGKARPILVGGTGLYFTALTEGLAQIPPTPPEIRAEADRRRAAEGAAALLAELDAETAARIDRRNPMRVQRAWEVLRATGRGLAAWQADTGPPLLPRAAAHALVLEAPRDWLAARIARRFDAMLADGALEEARAHLPHWDPAAPSSKAIGAAELVAHLRGEMPLAAAREAAVTLTRQYAKRQRSWFRNRMKDWQSVAMSPD